MATLVSIREFRILCFISIAIPPHFLVMAPSLMYIKSAILAAWSLYFLKSLSRIMPYLAIFMICKIYIFFSKSCKPIDRFLTTIYLSIATVFLFLKSSHFYNFFKFFDLMLLSTILLLYLATFLF